MPSSKAEIALSYFERGWSVIPIYEPVAAGVCACYRKDQCKSVGKHPRIPQWERLVITDFLVKDWWTKWPDANIGVRLDGLIDVDVDDPVWGEKLIQLAFHDAHCEFNCPQWGSSRGRHRLFKIGKYTKVQLPATKLVLCDNALELRIGGSAQSVFPGSVHGTTFQPIDWTTGFSPDDMELPEFPEDVLAILVSWKESGAKPEEILNTPEFDDIARTMQHRAAVIHEIPESREAPAWSKLQKRGVIEEGSRNSALYSFLCSWSATMDMAGIPADDAAARLEELSSMFNETRLRPSLDLKEEQQTFTSALRHVGKNPPRRPPATAPSTNGAAERNGKPTDAETFWGAIGIRYDEEHYAWRSDWRLVIEDGDVKNFRLLGPFGEFRGLLDELRKPHTIANALLQFKIAVDRFPGQWELIWCGAPERGRGARRTPAVTGLCSQLVESARKISASVIATKSYRTLEVIWHLFEQQKTQAGDPQAHGRPQKLENGDWVCSMHGLLQALSANMPEKTDAHSIGQAIKDALQRENLPWITASAGGTQRRLMQFDGTARTLFANALGYDPPDSSNSSTTPPPSSR